MGADKLATMYLCPMVWRHEDPRALQSASKLLVMAVSLTPQEIGANTVILSVDGREVLYAVLSNSGAVATEGKDRFDNIVSDMGITDSLSNKVGMGRGYMPLFLISSDAGEVATYSATVFYESRILFLNSNLLRVQDSFTTSQRVEDSPPTGAFPHQFNLAFQNHYWHRLSLNNHNSFFSKYEPTKEIEDKINLPPGTSIWDVARRLYSEEKPYPFVLRFMDPFNLWDFDNYLFEVTEPESERGYISFIPCPDGTCIVKRKVFAKDTQIREERRQRNVHVKDSFENYILDMFPTLTWRMLPAFRRVRYDVDLESLDTGNIYSIEFDQTSILGKDYPPLIQCEIEYVQTRSIHKPRLVLEDLSRVHDFVTTCLSKFGLNYQESTYSKLSYLRDYESQLSQQK